MGEPERAAVDSMEEVASVRLEAAYGEIVALKAKAASDVIHIEELENKLVKYATKHGKATALVGSSQRELKAVRKEAAETIAALDSQLFPLRKVWSSLWNMSMANGAIELGGDMVQELFEKAGLLVKVPFDLETGLEGAEPGEMIYVLTDLGRSCVQPVAEEK